MAGHLRTRCSLGVFVCALLCPPAGGQQQLPPLEAVLAHLEANYLEYTRSVPNLFCDEHVKSSYGPGVSFAKPVESVTESTFRLQRAIGPDQKAILKESRDIKTIDGKPAVSQTVGGPSILSGVFGSALGLVSSSESKCMNYRMYPRLSGSRPETRRIVIDFSMLPRLRRDPACGTRESQGRAFIDPDTLRLRRIQVKTTGYEILPNILGEWDWSADYDPVLFDGKPFWLPHTIDSSAVSYGINAMAWTFTAQYSGCHQLAVKSRILTDATTEVTPESDGAAQPPPAPAIQKSQSPPH